MADSTEQGDVSEAETFLRYDPFAPEDNAEDSAPTGEEEVATGTDGDVQEEAAPVAPVEPAPTQVTTDPTLTALLEQQTRLLETALKPPVVETTPEPEAPRFAVQLPEGLVNMLNSEEPSERSAAINNIVNGVANMAFAAAKDHIEQRFAAFAKELPQHISTHTESITTQRDAQQMFYSAYPKLADPAIRGTVGAVAQEVGQQWMRQGKPFTGMTQEFADAIAAAVAQKFSVPVDVFKAQAPASPPAAPQPTRQPFAAPSTPRPQPQPTSEDAFAKFGLDF